MDCIRRTRHKTSTESYTFRMVRCLPHINIHFAYFCALVASGAFAVFDFNAEKGYLIKQRINGAERADPFAKRPVKQNAQDDNGIAPSRTPCGHIYLQKNGSPIPTEFVTSIGRSITKTIRITYFRYRRGFSLAVENFFPGIL